MESLLHRLESQMETIQKTVRDLKSENEILRDEIRGIGISASSISQPEEGSIENKTLREILEETQCHVKALKDKILRDQRLKKENPRKLDPPTTVPETITAPDESDGDSSDESLEDFELLEIQTETPALEIRSKTMQDERKWMKKEFMKMIIKRKLIKEEEHFQGKTLEDISSLIPLSQKVVATCTLKLSNFLDSTLSNPEYYLWFASSVTGPSKVLERTSDVFSFAGDSVCCAFLCSYEISTVLRLTLYCLSYGNDNGIAMGIAFTPGDVPTNLKLFNSLLHFPLVPDVCIIKPPNNFPLEAFVSHGNLVTRCHMTLGPRSIVHVDIFEVVNEVPTGLLFPSEPQSGQGIWEDKIKQPKDSSGDDSGLTKNIPYYFEIVNWLRVTLRPGDMLPTNDRSEILSFQGERFLAGDNETVNGICAYEIDSTDLVFVAGLKVRPDLKSFFGAFFVQNPCVFGAELDALMAPRKWNGWKMHTYKIHVVATEDIQTIQIRNIRAELQFTEDEEQGHLKIRLFAV